MNRISTAGWLGFAAGLALTGGMLQAETDPPNLLTPHNEVAAVETPPQIVFSTYLGGSEQDSGFAVAVDEAGNVYVGGSTSSADIPGTAGGYDWPPYALYPWPEAYFSKTDNFVTKLAPDGSLRFTAFVGGPWPDSVWGITVGASSVYLAGRAMGGDSSNAWVAWLPKEAVGPGGGFFEYYVGGYWSWPYVADIALDPSGHMIVTGGLGMMCGIGDPVGIVAKLDGYHRHYLTFLEGVAWWTNALAVDEQGNAYIAGYKLNWIGPGGCFPQTEGDVLVAKLDPDGKVVWVRTFGEGENDSADDIALSPEGILYVLGRFGDPEPNAPDRPFLAAMTLEGDVLYSVELEASRASQLAVDRAGGLYLLAGSSVLRLDPRDLRVIRSAELPGASVWAFTVDSGGHAVLTGTPRAGFPVVNAFQPAPGGGHSDDAFVTKIAMNRPPDCSAAVVASSTLWPPNGRLIPIGVHGITEADGDPFTLTFTEVRQDEPLSRPGTPDAAGVGTGALFLRSDRAGKGDGRVYHVAFEARDVLGAACAGEITVCVPHDARNGAACGDGGAVVDSSFGG